MFLDSKYSICEGTKLSTPPHEVFEIKIACFITTEYGRKFKLDIIYYYLSLFIMIINDYYLWLL